VLLSKALQTVQRTDQLVFCQRVRQRIALRRLGQGRLVQLVHHVSFISKTIIDSCRNKIMNTNHNQSLETAAPAFRNSSGQSITQGGNQTKKGTFISKVERFQSAWSATPGPGAY
jgi:hypothetical protein